MEHPGAIVVTTHFQRGDVVACFRAGTSASRVDSAAKEH